VVLQGKKMAPREHTWSTIVNIVSYPCDKGSPVIRSIAICIKGGAFSSMVIL
jgi:hypothetical protein